MNVAANIVKIRKKLRLSQGKFVKFYNSQPPLKLTLSQPLLSRYESGLVMPPADKYQKMLDIAAKSK